MGKIATPVKHHKIAVQQRWISSGERDRLSYFSSWIKTVRQYKAGKLRNSAAMLWYICSNQGFCTNPPQNTTKFEQSKL